ncbi:hypothetical protein BCR41DRAFT_356899 [Lobosporangium transversale]|uniref:Restriction of telomere capping protein 5 n=1 Tax=Lobosporangium transversale TaxID=64571 RepID=A0A1Y2GIN3_9FUNG|nr:hypothetical protein BCR41DRAFT_356899 [Lobosporangium transversale]ORZ11769.1 hypothetical protein BCR41DRAFT_356899 [Lobosporangium transversale]|eukprot:XP_021879866.1 hypothetical protein BCR41DRAFT_356899 [Lobosporangium transversale]
MGAVQSLFDHENEIAAAAETGRQQSMTDQKNLSWGSTKLHKSMASKFTELEMLSLRTVLQQLQQKQDKAIRQQAAVEANASQTKKDIRPVSGITEATFVEYLDIPGNSRAAQLLFRSFYNLSVYPDHPETLRSQGLPKVLTARDFIKPLALYCQKVSEGTFVDLNPLKVIFESFAATVPKEQDSAQAHGSDNNVNNTNTDADTLSSLGGEGSLHRSKTIEDSLKELTLQWDPEDEEDVDSGPKVEALDLVEVLDGLFCLIEQVLHYTESNDNGSPTNDSAAESHSVSITTTTIGSHRHRALIMVEHLIQYSKASSSKGINTPLDLTSELIDFAMFSKYVSRNIPNLFQVLSPYFYNLFLIGNTLRPTGSNTNTSTAGKYILPGVSPIPKMSAPSTILTPETIALVSWFLPLSKTTPTMTLLYAGSQHGFSMSQFESHVCKYPAPTLLLLLVERRKTAAPTSNRRKSISFGSALSHHAPSYNAQLSVESSKWPSDRHSSSSSEGLPINVAPRPIVRKERLVLGAYVSETWKVSKTGWGNDSFALFELSPWFEVFPAKVTNSSTTAANKGPPRSLPARTSPRQAMGSGGAAANQQKRDYIHFLKNVGIGFGGQESNSCLLFMDDDNFQYGSYRQDFAGGNVYMNAGGERQLGFEIDFEVIECEVWGLGGPEAKARQKKEWDFEQREANRRATIHLRSKDGEQDIDRDLLEMAGVLDPDRGHRHARRQSAV